MFCLTRCSNPCVEECTRALPEASRSLPVEHAVPTGNAVVKPESKYQMHASTDSPPLPAYAGNEPSRATDGRLLNEYEPMHAANRTTVADWKTQSALALPSQHRQSDASGRLRRFRRLPMARATRNEAAWQDANNKAI